jgi:hypothetical protein
MICGYDPVPQEGRGRTALRVWDPVGRGAIGLAGAIPFVGRIAEALAGD